MTFSHYSIFVSTFQLGEMLLVWAVAERFGRFRAWRSVDELMKHYIRWWCESRCFPPRIGSLYVKASHSTYEAEMCFVRTRRHLPGNYEMRPLED